MKKKFILEFDEEPALVFVEHESGGRRTTQIYQDGKEIRGWRSARISSAIDYPTTHEIEYLTGYTKGDEFPSTD